MDNELIIAYLAGIIDGEGTIRITEGKVKGKNWKNIYNCSIRVGMTEPEPLLLLYEVFGGALNIEKRTGNSRDIYRWAATGNKIAPPIIKRLLPYLIVKKEQAETVLEFVENFKLFNGKNTPDEEYEKRVYYFKKLKELKNGKDYSEYVNRKKQDIVRSKTTG